ncbi:hypothetical protein [Nonomuraea gerenzanensis]|nr:hypothetical protein [Nonomuraea gerenzanensis]
MLVEEGVFFVVPRRGTFVVPSPEHGETWAATSMQ